MSNKYIPQRFMLVFVLIIAASHRADAEVKECTMVISGEAEIVSFNTKIKEGKEVPIESVLMKPVGSGPFPGIVILPGEGAVHTPRCAKGILRLFASLGYVSLLIDSNSANRPSRYLGKAVFEDQARDAHNGKDFLSTLPYVQPDRIGIIGWWLGGSAVLDAVSNNEKPFRAAVAIYPLCFEQIQNLATPLHIFIGEKDNRASATSCRNMKVTAKGAGDFQLTVYPNAGHWYDFPWLSVTYDEVATEDTYERLIAFFANYLKR